MFLAPTQPTPHRPLFVTATQLDRLHVWYAEIGKRDTERTVPLTPVDLVYLRSIITAYDDVLGGGLVVEPSPAFIARRKTAATGQTYVVYNPRWDGPDAIASAYCCARAVLLSIDA